MTSEERLARRPFPWARRLVRRAVIALTDGLVSDGHPLDDDLTPPQRLRRWARLEEAERRHDESTLEATHRRFWRGPGGATWHARHQDGFDAGVVRTHASLIASLQELAREGRGLVRLVELGTGRGRALTHLRRLLPGLEEFVGVDLAEATLLENRERLPGITFVGGDLVEYVETESRPGTIYLTSGGVLEYVSRARVLRLFQAVARRPPTVLALIEPLDREMDPDTVGPSCIFGEERSFSHRYPVLLRRHGFRIVHRRQLTVDRWRFIEIVARKDR